jgi:tRNA U54 and U55 pseudouridine synthase Pus10
MSKKTKEVKDKSKTKMYRVNVISQMPVFTNSLKVKRQLEKNAKKVFEETAFKVSWNKS